MKKFSREEWELKLQNTTAEERAAQIVELEREVGFAEDSTKYAEAQLIACRVQVWEYREELDDARIVSLNDQCFPNENPCYKVASRLAREVRTLDMALQIIDRIIRDTDEIGEDEEDCLDGTAAEKSAAISEDIIRRVKSEMTILTV